MCNDKQCIKNRRNLNPNSFESVSKRKKISIDEAVKWVHENNKSPFYKNNVENIDEYRKKQRRDLNFFIEKYGEEDGKSRYSLMLQRISKANKKDTMIQKYGKKRAEEICKSKGLTLEKFSSLYGEEKGKIKYLEFIKKSTKIGLYIENNKFIQSKAAFKFFNELTEKLKQFKVIKDEKEVIFCNETQNEFQVIYEDENKLRWFNLDFLIKKYNVVIEYNGHHWHEKDNISEDTRWNFRINKLNELGYKVFIVWDYDVETTKDKRKIFIDNFVKTIKDFINEKFE